MDLPHHIFLAAEAATHQLSNDTHTRLIPTHHTRHLSPILIRNLRTAINFYATIRGRHSDAAFRFEEGMIVNRRMERVLQNHIRLSKALLHVTFANLDVLEQISLFMDLRDSPLRVTRLHWIRDHGLEVELRLDQS